MSALRSADYRGKVSADIKATDSTGRTALHYIRGWNCIGNSNSEFSRQCVAFVDQLVQHGIDVNHQDKDGATALMNAAADSCSPASIRLLLSHGANTGLKDKLGKSALDKAIERATASSQNAGCNDVVKILYNPQQVSNSSLGQPVVADNSTSANSVQQGVASYAGTYSGSYSGSDSGVFEATILADGSATFKGKPNAISQYFTGTGKVESDGSVVLKSAEIDSVYTGRIDQTGALKGTWKSEKYKMAGYFNSSKVASTSPANPMQAIGGFLGGLNKILAPQH